MPIFKHLLPKSSALALLLAIPISSASTGTRQWSFNEIPSSANLTWYPCDGLLCSRLDVPLDYFHPHASRASLALIKLPASPNVTYKGMVLTNPGGPGGSGIQFIQQSGNTIQSIIGSNYDLVSWDPRGVGETLPAGCVPPSHTTTTLRRRRGTNEPRLKLSPLSDSFFENIVKVSKEWADYCEPLIGGAGQSGQYSTTADGARDMRSIIDAYANTKEGSAMNEPQHLNYWGFSYGTVLGQTFASLFPHRVGRVVLDGVESPEQYISGISQAVVDQDDLWGTFFEYCHAAGPGQCAFYTGTTALDIFNRFERSALKLDPRQAEIQNWKNATSIGVALVWLKFSMFNAAYAPISTFPAMAEYFVGFEGLVQNFTDDNLSIWMTNNPFGLPADLNLVIKSQITNPETQISCSDEGSVNFNKTLAELRPIIEAYEKESVVAGEFWAVAAQIVCTQWPIFGKHPFAGPFGGNTRNPILFVSNTLDPVTPIIDSQSAAPKYKNAQILTIDGTGHTSLYSQNLCAYGKIGTFFQTGALPGKDNFCSLEAGPFGIILPGGLKGSGVEKQPISRLLQR